MLRRLVFLLLLVCTWAVHGLPDGGGLAAAAPVPPAAAAPQGQTLPAATFHAVQHDAQADCCPQQADCGTCATGHAGACMACHPALRAQEPQAPRATAMHAPRPEPAARFASAPRSRAIRPPIG